MALCRRQSKTSWTEQLKSRNVAHSLASWGWKAHWSRPPTGIWGDTEQKWRTYKWVYILGDICPPLRVTLGTDILAPPQVPMPKAKRNSPGQAEFSCLFWQERAGESAEGYLQYSWHSWQRGAACKDKSSKFPAKCHPFQEAGRVRVWTGLEVVSTPLTTAGLMLTGFLSQQALIREGFCSREMRNWKYITQFPFCFCV